MTQKPAQIQPEPVDGDRETASFSNKSKNIQIAGGNIRRPADACFRVAFLTHEFVTEYGTGGGLGNYLNKMTQALLHAGHVPEIFVISFALPAVIMHQGVRVNRVHPDATHGVWRWMPTPPRFPGLGNIREAGKVLSWAAQLGQAFEARD